jgi:hypothetical protein
MGAGVIAGIITQSALATIPYTPVVLPPNAQPGIGPGVIAAPLVFGKEYSHDYDTTTIGAVGPPPPADPEQVIAWDGIGGAADGLDYSLSRPVDFPREQEVDAIANSRDALYNQLRRDRAHLILSHDDRIGLYPGGAGPFFPAAGTVVPPFAPVAISNGSIIGGSGDLSVEESGFFSGAPPEVQYLWTPAPSINGMPPTTDIDGVEVWGPEPGIVADSDKYSLEDDIAQTGGGPPVSIFHYVLPGGPSVPYITHPTIVSAVESLLGFTPTTAFNQYDRIWRDAINLDALMVQDVDGVIEQFGPGDSIIFSISQMIDPADPDGYYATGSELFVMELTAAGGLSTSYLRHGGHSWSHGYTLGAMGVLGLPPNARAYIDINAIEAIGALVVPEPSSYVLLAFSLIGICNAKRRR